MLVMGDMNLNFKQWNTMDGHEGEMVEDMNNRIVTTGFTQEIDKTVHVARDRVNDY